ncbi:cell division cycle ATPase, putative [Plasmodium chabaudi chabaudi]|uniref:Cell division cycle ATPase, putative n=1 Tax=Plasmodium chabaudi chabaudi TaxID=31271 RepID=A0A4V0KBJ8_PLACU|nr:cell division cycle ATPase, putative [Plasmodium chabaudi chabaudi]VTZ69694.1 cell division cycle ATPase, putative [Plasmodium chabaudi chabaudi]|eukprot:XP_734701.2 cell division cycle ATPase, putative [Plasmodium chabaudi chabaudi]
MKGKKMCYSLFFFKEHIKRYIIVIFVFFMITCTNQIKLTQHGNIITAKNCNGNGNTNLFWGNNGARNIFGRTTKRRNPFASIGAIVNEKISNKNKKKQNEMFGKFAVVGTPNETTKKYNDIEHDAKERDTTSSDFQLNCDKPKFIKEENVNYENKTDKFIKTLPKEVNLIDEEQAHDSIFSNDKIDEVISKKDNTSKSIINSIFQNIWGSNNSSKSQDYNKGNDNGGDGDNNKNEPNERDDRGRKNERDEKGISYEEPDETNFLLKALNSGKFPNYCLVENIDENADNFDIYMSKEKMKELNINDGYTILLKGKKKKEMVGIAREDDRLNKYSVTISFSMKRNLRLMHNDIIKIYPLSNIKNIKNVIVSPFSDTVNNITKEEIEKEILNTYLKNSYKPLSVDSTIYINYKNKRIELKVLKIITQDGQSEKHGCLTNTSRLTLSETFLNREDYEENTDDINYEDLGGMKKQLNKIRELIELPLKYPEIFMSIGISAPKGVLMHGIPGTGKTSIAKAIANESNAYCYIINGPEIMSKHIGESEQKLRKIFKKASEKTPCIIFIDEIDSIANKRNKSSNELEKRVVSQLLTLMDGLKKNNNVLVLAATNRPNSLDPALRRFGRFDREIEIPVPDEQGRYEILLTKTKKMKLDPDVNLRKIAKECHGYVGADLAQLCFEAAIQCIKEHIHFLDLEEEDFIEFMKLSVDGNTGENSDNNKSEHAGESSNFEGGVKGLKNVFRLGNQTRTEQASQNNKATMKKSGDKFDQKTKRIPSYILNKLTIKAKHFQHALNICNPSSLRERQVQIPTVTWDDIGGMQYVKEQLKETILYPLEYKHLYNKFNSNYNKGILLYGPPGCGKTLLAKAIANECNANFISVKGPELLTMWFGESEANVRDLFDKARAASPCIIFFDEIDSLAKERNSNNNNDASDRVINQILTEIDGINEKKTIFIIAATNRPDILDKALTRPGRLDKLIYISLPDFKSRCSIFKAILKNTPLNKDVDINEMAKRTEGFSGADITNLCQSAVNEAIKETIHLINLKKGKSNKHDKKRKSKGGQNHLENYDPVPTLSKKHFDVAFKNARISIQPEDVLKYEKFKEKLSLKSNS